MTTRPGATTPRRPASREADHGVPVRVFLGRHPGSSRRLRRKPRAARRETRTRRQPRTAGRSADSGNPDEARAVRVPDAGADEIDLRITVQDRRRAGKAIGLEGLVGAHGEEVRGLALRNPIPRPRAASATALGAELRESPPSGSPRARGAVTGSSTRCRRSRSRRFGTSGGSKTETVAAGPSPGRGRSTPRKSGVAETPFSASRASRGDSFPAPPGKPSSCVTRARREEFLPARRCAAPHPDLRPRAAGASLRSRSSAPR